MFNYVYAIYNKLAARYESVLTFPSDSMALHRLEKNLDKEEYELCRVGKISIESGVITPENPVRLVWSNPTELPTTEAK